MSPGIRATGMTSAVTLNPEVSVDRENRFRLWEIQMGIIDRIRGRRKVVHKQDEGLDLAYRLIEKHNERTYFFKSSKCRYSDLSGEELLERLRDEMEGVQIIYGYITKTKEYIDRSGRKQIEIVLIGKAGMRGRYNPWDIEMKIETKD